MLNTMHRMRVFAVLSIRMFLTDRKMRLTSKKASEAFSKALDAERAARGAKNAFYAYLASVGCLEVKKSENLTEL